MFTYCGLKRATDSAIWSEYWQANPGRWSIIPNSPLPWGSLWPRSRLYLWYLEKTFIVSKVTPWFTNIRKEITKAPVYYFCDIGLRNFSSGSFGALSDSEAGFAFQTVIYAMLKERFPLADTTIHYWRTKDKAEVDFVIRRGESVTPLEVKYRDMKKAGNPTLVPGVP